MRIGLGLSALGACLALAGCGDKQAPNAENFGAAIQHYLESKGQLCLGFSHWPVDVREGGFPTVEGTEIATLESIGLVSSAVTHVESFGLSALVKRYELTAMGRTFSRKKRRPWALFVGDEVDICYGRWELGEVVQWQGPVKLGEHQQALVTYTCKIGDRAEWVGTIGFQAVFRRAAAIVDGEGKRHLQVSVKLTKAGWEVVSGT